MFRIPRFLALFPKQKGIVNYSLVGSKSRYSFPAEYPEQWDDRSFAKKKEVEKLNSVQEGKFEGFIPIDKIDIKYLSGSPERSATDNLLRNKSKVEIRFKVETAEWLPQNLRDIILKKGARLVDSEGYITVTSDRTRKQMLNQADCLQKIRDKLFYFNELIQKSIKSDNQDGEKAKQTYKGIRLYRHVPVDLKRKDYTNNFRYTKSEKAILDDRLLEEQRYRLSIHKEKKSPETDS